MSINDPGELKQQQLAAATRSAAAAPTRLGRHAALWLPILIGVIIGGLLLSRVIVGPPSIGAGIGGFAGLGVGLLFRFAIHIR